MEDKSKRVELEVEDLVLASKLKLPAKEMVKRVRVEMTADEFLEDKGYDKWGRRRRKKHG